MIHDSFPKILLVVPLHLGHGQKTVQHLRMATSLGVISRIFVFANVVALQPPGRVHGNEPAQKVTGNPESPADQKEPDFAEQPRLGIQLSQQISNEATMMPFVFLDLSNLLTLC